VHVCQVEVEAQGIAFVTVLAGESSTLLDHGDRPLYLPVVIQPVGEVVQR
jgi:hypothetical protein